MSIPEAGSYLLWYHLFAGGDAHEVTWGQRTITLSLNNPPFTFQSVSACRTGITYIIKGHVC